MSGLAYSDGALDIIALHNGVDRETMRRIRPIAPNPYMHRWMEALGARLVAGLPTRSAPDRWLVPEEMPEMAQGGAI